MQKSLEQAQKQGFLDLNKWANDTVRRIQLNYWTQNIWPLGYPGPYKDYRKKNTGSTGNSFRHIYAKVYNSAKGDTTKISFFFKYYLYFVDMGVGRGRSWEFQYEDAKYNKLFHKWDGEGDRQQRPFLTMELRHQIRRLSAMLENYYAEKIQIDIVSTLEDLD